jgi:hypothetical protein
MTMNNTYQEHCYQQEKQEYFNDCVKAAVETEVKRIINSATCFDCDNPVTVLETEEGICVKECSKCHGVPAEIMPAFEEWDGLVQRINKLTAEMNGRGM